ncbi:MAG: Uma2 family endonuclease [Actinobacteria bacterium]|nr:Uma2 family endonuclease [Actinomycetota bacterium]
MSELSAPLPAGVPVATGLTYDDLFDFPDDHLRRELIDGELYVTAPPIVPHQHAVTILTVRLFAYVEEHGGRVYPAPTGVWFAEDTHVEPDVVLLTRDHLERLERRYIRGGPDIAIEVSSPSTRRLDLINKRNLYEREGVAEFWFVDLEVPCIDVHRLRDGAYGAPETYGPGQRLTTPLLPGFELDVEEVFDAER